MNTFKSLCAVIVLGAVAYGVYVGLSGGPPHKPPKGAPTQLEDLPDVELPDTDNTASSTLPGLPSLGQDKSKPKVVPAGPAGGSREGSSLDDAPRYQPRASTAADSAPPFVPPNVGPSTDERRTPAYPSTGDEEDAADETREAEHEDPGGAVRTSYDDASSGVGEPPADFAAALADVQDLLDRDELAQALLELSQWYDERGLSEVEQEELLTLLNRVAGTVIYSHEHLLEPPYVVQPGDSLERIAQQYEIPWRLLAKINGLEDSSQLTAGEALKVVRGPFDAVVDMGKFRLTLFVHGRYAGRFDIGLGRDDVIREGEYIVKAKTTDPTYYGPDQTVDADDPDNPLGELLIDLGDGVGLHGTNDPRAVGRADGRGSICMQAADMGDVFDILSAESEQPNASRVIIRK